MKKLIYFITSIALIIAIGCQEPMIETDFARQSGFLNPPC